MPRRRRKTKYVTKRALPFLLMKNAETKQRTHEDLSDPLSNILPVNLDFSTIVQGTGEEERIGQEIQISSIFFKCTFSNSLSQTTPTDKAYYARVLLYSPRDPDESPIDIVPMQFPDRQKYIIWADKVVPLPWVNSISNSMITIKKKFKPYMKAVYTGTGSGSCVRGKLRLLICTDADTGLAEVSYMARQYYKDL